jgi:hypothetical protein
MKIMIDFITASSHKKSPPQSATSEISLCGTTWSKAQTKSAIENPKSDRKILKVSAAAAAVP